MLLLHESANRSTNKSVSETHSREMMRQPESEKGMNEADFPKNYQQVAAVSRN